MMVVAKPELPTSYPHQESTLRESPRNNRMKAPFKGEMNTAGKSATIKSIILFSIALFQEVLSGTSAGNAIIGSTLQPKEGQNYPKT